jgi:hypothetical protein
MIEKKELMQVSCYEQYEERLSAEAQLEKKCVFYEVSTSCGKTFGPRPEQSLN